MKQVKENGIDIEYTKTVLTITKAKRLLDGTRIELATISFDTEPECNFEYDAIKGEEVKIPWPIQTRDEAARLGQRKYYTGTLCKLQHISQRYVCSGRCITCTSNKSKGFKINRAAAARGLVPVTVMVHPQSVKAMEAYADLINQQEEL